MSSAETIVRTRKSKSETEQLAEQIPGGVKWGSNGEGQIHCPFHDDKNPSCSVNAEKNTFLCHACGEKGTLTKLLKHCGINLPGRSNIDTSYDYTNNDGKVIYRICRTYSNGKKDFFAQHPEGSGWKKGMAGTRPVLYRLHEITRAIIAKKPVFLVEGEKDVDRLRQEHLVATTSPFGAKSWNNEYAKYLTGASVVLIGDYDQGGRTYIRKVAKSLIGVAGRIRQLDLGYEITKDHGKDITDWLTEHSREELINLARETEDFQLPEDLLEPGEQQGGYKLVQVADLPLQQPHWLIKWFLELDEFSELFGDPGAGKTIMAVDWGCRVATGTPWCGIKVRQGAVIYVCGEGQRSIRRRIRAWEIRNEIDMAMEPLYILPHAVQIVTPESMSKLNQAITAIIEKAGDPALVVFDTLSRNFGPGNENLPMDMSLAIAAADKLRNTWKCCVLFVHHPGHGDKGRGRGCSNLAGALDTDYLIEKDANDIVRLEARKTKDGNPPAPKAFKLREVELGLQDEDGCEITSVVLDEIDYEPKTEGKEGKGKHQKTMLEILNQMTKQYRNNLEKGGQDPDNVRIEIGDWKKAAIDAGVPKGAWYRNINALDMQGKIKIQHGYVYAV